MHRYSGEGAAMPPALVRLHRARGTGVVYSGSLWCANQFKFESRTVQGGRSSPRRVVSLAGL